MATAAGKAKVRKLPVRTADINLDGEFEGWQLSIRTSPPLGKWIESLQRVLDSQDGEEEANPRAQTSGVLAMLDLIALVLVRWNFVDEEGNDIEATRDGLGMLPLELISLVFDKVTATVGQAPLASNGNSPS